MSDLQQQLEALANRGDPRGASDVLRNARRSIADAGGNKPAPHASRRRIIALVAAAATILAIAGGAVLLVRDSGDGEPRVVATGGIGTEDQDASMTGAPLFLVPRTVPDGFQLLRASGGDQPGFSAGRGGSPEWDRTQRWVRFDATHERPVEILDIQWRPGATAVDLPSGPDGSDDVLGALRYQSVPVEVRGRDGVFSEQNGWLAWEEPDGQAVLVSANRAREDIADSGTPLSREFLYAVAEGLEPRNDGGFDLLGPPEGFELVAEWPGVASEGTNPRTLTYQGPDGRGLQLHIVDDTESPPGTNLYFSSARLVDVRGHDAVLSPFLFTPPGSFDQETLFMLGADRFVQWLESADTRVTISGLGLSDSEILAIARDLEVVDAETWFGLGRSEPSPIPTPALPEPSGPPPEDEAAARDEIIRAFSEWGAVATLEQVEETNRRLVDNPHGLLDVARQALENYPDEVANDSYRVTDVRFSSQTEAVVVYDIVVRGAPLYIGRVGNAVLIDGTWKLTRATVCNDLSLAGGVCPP